MTDRDRTPVTSSALARFEMRGITKRFGGVVALDDVDLDAAPAEVHAICGENGAGKSTLMKILSGAITDFEGTLRIDGDEVRFRGPGDAERRRIAAIYQELNLAPHLSAAANIFLGREPIRGGLFLDERRMAADADALFDRIGADIDPQTRVGRLRIGDQQLVEIAKALAASAQILIMDEPTSALADAEVERLFLVIETLKRQGVTILYISHRMDEVFRIADRITVLRDGRRVRTARREDVDAAEVIRLMVGREIASLDLAHDPPSGAVVLEVDGLTLPDRRRPGALRLDHVSLSLRRGEIVGVAGLLGAGRTELLECLFGASAIEPQGKIVVDGRERLLRSPADAIAASIAMVTEDRKALGLFFDLDVAGNVSLCHLRELSDWGMLGRRRESRVVERSIERLGIRAASSRVAIRELSGGNQQKVILARWLLVRPAVLLLDEPTRGIDVGAKAEIYVLLRELCREGIGVLMTSSELPELLHVCDRIIVLCEGRKTAEFARGAATEEDLLHAAVAFRKR